MNVLNRMMSYDKTKNENQENCNCAECLGNAEISKKTEIIGNFEYADDFLIKVENYRMMCREYEILNTINTEYWYKDVKTKNFIWKSLHVHGDKYIYHKSVYVKSKEKLLIECRVEGHEPFPQRANDHLNGHGCKLCGIKTLSEKQKMTLKEFIEEANKVHGKGRYDYSKVNYINMDTEVIIICPNHDEPYEFPQKPHDHLQRKGCPICGRKVAIEKHRLTLQEFIERAYKKYGIGRYDYSKVKYTTMNTLVCIICPNHNEPYEFWKTPHNHLNGVGCPLCNESIGNNKIRMFLINNNIKFENEKTFDNCEYIKQLRFDFYVQQYNLCIEFDGEQHFEKVNWDGKMTDEEMEENLKLNQFRDQIKNDYCKNNGINLLRIRYDENVEEKLFEYFKNHGIVKELTLFDL